MRRYDPHASRSVRGIAPTRQLHSEPGLIDSVAIAMAIVVVGPDLRPPEDLGDMLLAVVCGAAQFQENAPRYRTLRSENVSCLSSSSWRSSWTSAGTEVAAGTVPTSPLPHAVATAKTTASATMYYRNRLAARSTLADFVLNIALCDVVFG